MIKAFALDLKEKNNFVGMWYLVIAKSYVSDMKQELLDHSGEVLISSVICV